MIACSHNSERFSGKTAADVDTPYYHGSGIQSLPMRAESIQQLTNLGILWGFLKYYHPSVAAGNFNWDTELIHTLKKISTCESTSQIDSAVESLAKPLNSSPPCKECPGIDTAKIKLFPDYAGLFDSGKFSAALRRKLLSIRDNYKPPDQHYYVGLAKSGNAVFTHEHEYFDTRFPDAGIRLLALYRYWNMVNYFFPYRYLIGESWIKVLSEFIPVFLRAQNSAEYHVACLMLVSRIHDTHAFIVNPVLDSLKGNFILPFQAQFVEGRLILTGYYPGYYLSLPPLTRQIDVGDIIEEINGESVDTLVNKYLPLTPGSNFMSQLRDLSSKEGFLLRTDKGIVSLLIRQPSGIKRITLNTIPFDRADTRMDVENIIEKPGYKLLDQNVGYLYPAKLTEGDIDSIIIIFAKTKGIVIDLRCYPGTSMPYTYGSWLKASESDFALTTEPTLQLPGAILYDGKLANGQDVNSTAYKGKIVIIVNSITQSSAEFTAMALWSARNAIVIGDTTAGADGNVSNISLPGRVYTRFSGIGIYYPDSSETQRVGVKVDFRIKPTIAGIREGKDELLDRAIKLIMKK